MSQIASDAKISSAMSKLGMTAPLPNLDDSQVLKAILVALGNITSGGGGGTGTVTSVSFTGGLISVANPTTAPALTVAGTSGGIPYFSSTSTWASSALLDANALMIGGGAGAAPSTVTTGTGILTALGVNVGSAGAPVLFNGALGTPSSGTLTNCTGLPVAGITGVLPSANGGTGVNNAGTLTNATNTKITGGGTLGLGGFTLTVPATGTAALLGTANVFTALQTITQGSANAGILASTGYSLTGSNATNMVSLAGTLNTSGAPSVFKMALTVTATSASTKYIDIMAGAAGATPVFSLHAGTFGGTALGGQGIAFGDPNADGACTITSGRPGSRIYFGCTQQFGLDISFLGSAMAFRSGYLFQYSSTTDSFGSADLGFARNAAGVLEINSGTAGTFRDLKTRNAITNPVTVAGLAGATKGARSFVTDANTTLLLGFGTIVVGGGANNVPVYYDGTNWLIG